MRPLIFVRRGSGCMACDSVMLSRRLGLPLLESSDMTGSSLVLEYQDDRLVLRDTRKRTRPLFADIDSRISRYRSLPAPKRGPLAMAVGKKTRTVIDATAGWGQDLSLLTAMGYHVIAVERSTVMAALLADSLRRLGHRSDNRGRFELPRLVNADALQYLAKLGRSSPDCIYLDPMFPPKRKQSALAKRRLRLLREVVGDDEDRHQLFAMAMQVAGKRVVVKRPNDALPILAGPDETRAGKLVCYDVYLTEHRRG